MKTALRVILSAFFLVLLGLAVAGLKFWNGVATSTGPDGRPILVVTAIASAAGAVWIFLANRNRDEAPHGH